MAIREEITQLLQRAERGEREALTHLMPMIYEELRVMARGQIRRGPEQTLNTTGLVHEAYLKLVDQTQVSFANRRQFFCYTATTMRNIVVDSARKRLADKRGGQATRDDAGLDMLVAPEDAADLIALDQALGSLARVSARLAEIVELHVFAGLGFAEIAACWEVNERTVFRDWRKARTLLGGLLGGGEPCTS